PGDVRPGPGRGAREGHRPAGGRGPGPGRGDPGGPKEARGGVGLMTVQEIAFVIIGGIGSLAAIRLVTSRNVVHAALYLVVTLAMVGAVYLLVAAEFVAWVQVLIYVGAI